MVNERIRIITTGGTFDKFYDAVKGELTFRESHLSRILQQARVTFPVHLDLLLAVDSLLMTENQRDLIVHDALASFEKKVVIVHGTDTMTQTAELLQKNIKGKEDHVFVFTGAMIPYALENSDAIFNLGCALTAVQLLSPGVYISMGGKIYPAGTVRKNKEIGVFEAIQN